MTIFLLIISMAWATSEISLLNFCTEISKPAHQICENRLEIHSEYSALYKALACGTSIKGTTFYFLFRDLGILHLLVVSGAHLIWLEQGVTLFLRVFKVPPKKITPIILLIFGFFAGWNPPVVRSLFKIGASHLNKTLGLGWPPSLTILISGATLLVFFPEWWNSPSFLMSWVAGLTITTTAKLHWTLKGLSIYLLIGFYLGGLNSLPPSNIVLNLLLAPLWTVIYFPISLLTLLLPSSHLLFDPIWTPLILMLNAIHSSLDSSPNLHFKDPYGQWAYVLVLFSLFHLITIIRKGHQK